MPWAPTVPPAPARPAVTGWWALLRAVASQPLTLSNLATVKGIMLALQSFTLDNAAQTKGLSQATQSMTVADMAAAIGKQLAQQSFTVNSAASWYGKPGANQPIPILDSAVLVGIILAPQQISFLTEGLITGFEGTLSANQVIPLVDSATVAGMQAAGQSFTLVNTGALAGKPGADQVLALTETGAVVAISAAAVSLAITNAGTVYAVAAANQSFDLANDAAAVDATVYGPTFVGVNVSNSASGIYLQSNSVGDLCIGFGVQGTASVPGLPSGWTSLSTQTATNFGCRMAYKFATTTSDLKPTYSGATQWFTFVYSSVSAIGATAASSTSSSSTTLTFPALTLQASGSWVMRMCYRLQGQQTVTMLPAGWRTLMMLPAVGFGGANGNGMDSDGGLASGPSAYTTPSMASSSVYKSITVELKV